MSAQPGWYDDGNGTTRWWDGGKWTEAVQPPAGASTPIPEPAPADSAYIVRQIELSRTLWGADRTAAVELEDFINAQAALGYRLHTFYGSNPGQTGYGGSATLIFERIDTQASAG